MKRRAFLAVAAGAVAFRAVRAEPLVRVYRSRSCGCCAKWADHLRANGFTVEVINVPEPASYRRKLGIPDALGSCHTAEVDGYAIEGHVPARELQRLLKERPSAVGLAVPGMPLGSPGMESGGRRHPYVVLLVDRHGGYTAYAAYVR